MPITRQMIASKVEAYLRRQISLAELVDWAENQMMDGEFDTPESRDAAARLGLADVREFGLTWDECQQLLKSLGFSATVSIVTA